MLNFLTLFGRSITPKKIPGLALWLDAQDSSTLTTSASRVSQWSDKSGKANHAVQATGSLQPLLVSSAINGRPAIRFNDSATARLLSVADHTSLDYTTCSAFVVFQRVASTAQPERIFGKFSTTTPLNQREWVFNIVTDQLEVNTSADGLGGGPTAQTSTSVALATSMIGDFKFALSSVQARRNNDPVTAGSASLASMFASTSPIHLGARDGAAQPFDGYIGEAIFYNKVLTDTQRVQILRYLAKKWGITLAA